MDHRAALVHVGWGLANLRGPAALHSSRKPIDVGAGTDRRPSRRLPGDVCWISAAFRDLSGCGNRLHRSTRGCAGIASPGSTRWSVIGGTHQGCIAPTVRSPPRFIKRTTAPFSGSGDCAIRATQCSPGGATGRSSTCPEQHWRLPVVADPRDTGLPFASLVHHAANACTFTLGEQSIRSWDLDCARTPEPSDPRTYPASPPDPNLCSPA